VDRVPADLSGSARAQWLAELSEALDQAHDLMWKLGIGDGGGPAAMELYLRIEAARLEVQALRLGRRYQMAEDIDPKWSETSPWKRSGTEGC
jgi:hypothetical protein